MTNKELNKITNKYIGEVKSLIICDWKTRKKFVGDLKNSIFDYVDYAEVKSIDDISKQFGTPQDIARSFFDSVDIKKVKKRMNISKTIAIGITAALIIWAAGITAIVVDDIVHPGYIVDEITDEIPEGSVFYGSTDDEVTK